METKKKLGLFLVFLSFLMVGGVAALALESYYKSALSLMGMKKSIPDPWPPAMDLAFPDLELIDQNGVHFWLSDFKGKVIILEPVGMNCPACQAWSGGHDMGAFKGNPLQKNLPSFRKSFPRFTRGLTLPHKDIIFIQLLLYDMRLGPALSEHAAVWAEHFKMYKSENNIVAVSPYDLRNEASFNMIPGFYLIDRNFVLRADSTGHKPKHDLYQILMPMIPMALK